MMFNSIKSLLHIGNSTQTNVIIYDAKVDSSIKRMKKDFNEGKFVEAIDFLDSLLVENEHNVEVKYQLLLVKASFLMQLRKMDEFKEYIELIESNYIKFINTEFKELKLTLLAFENNQEFFELSKKLRLETPNSKPQGHFDIVFHLNGGDLNIAKDIFEKEIQNLEYRDKLLLIGGHIYSNLYKYDEDDENNFIKADEYYKKALENGELSFLDKMLIQGFYAHRFMNDLARQKKADNEEFLEYLKEYEKSLRIILNCKNYFNNQYINSLIETYAHVLLSLGLKNDYLKLYESNTDAFSIKYYIQYCDIKDTDYSHEKIQNYIKANFLLDDLLIYTSLISNNNAGEIKIIIDFLEKNKDYKYKHYFVMYCFVKGSILLDMEIKEDVLVYLKKNKYRELDCLLAFLEYQYYLGNTINDIEIEKLLELSDNFTVAARIVAVIELLQQLGKYKEYLSLALKKQAIFYNVIFKTLQICYEDKNLHIADFENFIKNLDNIEPSIIGAIADIYANFNAYDKSFEYFYLLYKEGNHNKEVLFKIIEIAFRYHQKTNGTLEEKKEREIYDILIANKEELDIRDLIFLFQYSLVVLKGTRQILPMLNEHLLNTDIKSLDKDIKIELSNIYTQTTIGMHSNYEQLFSYEDNICYVEDGKTYLKGYAVIEENKKNFGFETVNNNEFFSIKNNPQDKEESLFHRIVGPFAFKVNNPNMMPIPVNLDGENPFEEFFSFVNKISQQEKDLFQRYSQEEFYGLYPLTKHNYANYFTLIPYLLEHQDYSLNSLKPSFMIDRKKILTLSSIIFLNHLGYLDEMLKMENIVIQQTTINWLQKYIEDYSPVNRPTKFSYMDEEEPKFIPYTEEDEKEAIKFKDALIELTKKLLGYEIVDDTNENLPIAGAYKMLAREIGEQEYHALAYCIKHNYQIISENNIFEMLFDTFRYNKLFISNSFALLANTLKEEKLYTLQKKIYKLNYKYISNCPEMARFFEGLHYHKFKEILNDHLILNFKIWYEYGCLDELIKEYIHKYKVLFPKTILPKKDIFYENMEYLLEVLGVQKTMKILNGDNIL